MLAASVALWYTLTVIIPGLALYGAFRVLVGVLGIEISFLAAIDSSEVLTISVVIAAGMLLQVLGIALEGVLFRIGPYRHIGEEACPRCKSSNQELQDVFDRRYEIIALNPEKASQVEYLLGQFFMSHNLALGMTILLSWVITHLLGRFDAIALTAVLSLVVVAVALLWYVPYNRFHMSCKALLEFEQWRTRSTGG